MPTSAQGRQRLRERVGVEHSLAHVAQRQGNHARYDGVVKNRLHLHLVCAIQNVERARPQSVPTGQFVPSLLPRDCKSALLDIIAAHQMYRIPGSVKGFSSCTSHD